MKLLLISIIETLGVENVWDNILGKKASLTFGQECASATIWMFVILVLRTVLLLLGLTPFVPNGLVFSFPFLIQVGLHSLTHSLIYSFPLCLSISLSL